MSQATMISIDNPHRVPGPRGLPFIGHALSMKKDKLGFLIRLSQEYGDVAAFQMAAWPAVLLSSPSDIDSLVSDRTRSLRKSRFLWRQSEAVFGNGILSSHGEDWATQRSTLTPAFSAKRVASYEQTMREAVDRLASQWSGANVQPIHPAMLELTLDAAVRVLFSAKDDSLVEEMADINECLNEEIRRRLTRPIVIPDHWPWPGHRGYLRNVARLDRFIEKIIASRREDPTDHGDVLSIMLGREGGERLDDRSIRDQSISLLAAAHDTTASTLSWALRLLAENPHIQDEVADECSQFSATSLAGMAGLRRLPRTSQVLDETMRLYPSVWLNNRQNVTPMEIGGYTIPTGTSIYFSPYVVHRDPRWFDRPNEFMPDRWTKDFSSSLPRCAYMPFGQGPRLCLGRSFALQQMAITLAILLPRFRFEDAGTGPVRPAPSIALNPSGDVPLRVRPR